MSDSIRGRKRDSGNRDGGLTTLSVDWDRNDKAPRRRTRASRGWTEQTSQGGDDITKKCKREEEEASTRSE